MTREEVIRLIGNAIEDGLEAHDLLHDIAKAILNLGICQDCKGSGVKPHNPEPDVRFLTRCPTCKGTGREKFLAVLAENQELPEPESISFEMPNDTLMVNKANIKLPSNLLKAYLLAQQDMIKANWKKVVIE